MKKVPGRLKYESLAAQLFIERKRYEDLKKVLGNGLIGEKLPRRYKNWTLAEVDEQLSRARAAIKALTRELKESGFEAPEPHWHF